MSAVNYSLSEALKCNFILKLDGYYNKTLENYEMEDFHKHSRIELMLVEEGECEILFLKDENQQNNSEKIVLVQNEGVLIDSYVWHRLIVKRSCRIINLEYLPKTRTMGENNTLKELSRFSIELTRFLNGFTRYSVVYDWSNIRRIAKVILEEASSARDCSDFELGMNTITNMLFIEIARSHSKGINPGSYELPVRKAIRYIHANIRRRITSDEIAQSAGVSYGYLEVLFKKRTGMTLGEYIAKKKVELACTILIETATPVAAVAEQIGFGSRQQFNSSFRKIVGTSPQKYRQASSSEHEDIWFGFSGKYEFAVLNQEEQTE